LSRDMKIAPQQPKGFPFFLPETLFPLSVLLTIVMRPAPSLEIPSPNAKQYGPDPEQ